MNPEGKPIQFSLFTKHWKALSASELGRLVSGIGYDGIELPIRSGFQVEPELAVKALPEFAGQLEAYGVQIFSVAASTDESIFEACAKARVPMIRTMLPVDETGYEAAVQKAKQELAALEPLCERYGVKVGVQPHYGKYINDANGLMRILDGLNPEHIGAVWDAAHDALAGQQPEYGLEIISSHLAMVNLKNVFFTRTNGPEADNAEWKRHFTTGRHGLASWPRIADILKRQGYNGVICLTAEYTDLVHKDRFITEDLAYAKSLFA